MTKKHYFYGLWVLCSAVSIIQLIVVKINKPPVLTAGLVVGMLIVIAFYGFVSIMGIHFSQKAGARLLFIDGHYDIAKDILKPAFFVAVLGAGAILAIMHAVMLGSSIRVFLDAYSYTFIYRILPSLFSTLNSDVFLFLFCLPACALLIRKITKNISVTIVEYVSVMLIALLQRNIWLIWSFGPATTFAIGPTVNFGFDIILGMLFWKKGFETVVLCHCIMSCIFYVLVPVVIIAFDLR